MNEAQIAALRESVGTGEIIKIIYHGGSQPGTAREIVPVSMTGDRLWAVCLKSGQRKSFSLKKIELPNTNNVQAPEYEDIVVQEPEGLVRQLINLGVPGIGRTKAEALTRCFPTSEALQAADVDALAAAEGIGEMLAATLHSSLHNPDNTVRLTEELAHSRHLKLPSTKQSELLARRVFCFTGKLSGMTRAQAMERVRLAGGEAVDKLGSRVTDLVVGEKSGTKIILAKNMGIAVMNEADFLELLRRIDEA